MSRISGQLSGHVLSPDPAGGSFFFRDAVLAWDASGLLCPAGSDAASVGSMGSDLPAGCLLIPGLIDAHIHLPQLRVRGRFRDQLLPWLKEHIWPEEERFADRAYRQAVTEEFRQSLLAVGTTGAGVYGSPEASSIHAVLRDLSPLRIRGGDVLMDRNSPASLERTTAQALSDAGEAATSYGRDYLLTPRFAPTCSAELMEGCGRLLETSSVGLQTHLAENLDEVRWVADLHPDRRSYTEVYAHHGLLGSASIFGHCIHLDEQDIELLARSGSWVAHCPTSNIALGSGRMPIERLRAAGVGIALATDIGAGPDLSMLDVMRACRQVHAGLADVEPDDLLAMATLQGARALGLGQVGCLKDGWAADIVALRVPGGLGRGDDGSAALLRILETFEGRYDEAVAGVWIAGKRVAPASM